MARTSKSSSVQQIALKVFQNTLWILAIIAGFAAMFPASVTYDMAVRTNSIAAPFSSIALLLIAAGLAGLAFILGRLYEHIEKRIQSNNK
ncbi:hypothetical protein KC953_02310 [Candidatus Saccharibacteria bacterium]|nr:hypothetical protein [Candidatus Saccharibacteria bacterium]